MGFLLSGFLCGYLIDGNTIYVIEGEPIINNYIVSVFGHSVASRPPKVAQQPDLFYKIIIIIICYHLMAVISIKINTYLFNKIKFILTET